MKRVLVLSFCGPRLLVHAGQTSPAEPPAKLPAAGTNRINILFLMDDQHRQHFNPQRNTHGYQTVELGEPFFKETEPMDDYGKWFASQMPGRNPFAGDHSGNDQRCKYVYYTLTGAQQLFDRESDPQELRDLAGEPASASLVGEWRQKMAKHLGPARRSLGA
jgi:hypothetical protein